MQENIPTVSVSLEALWLMWSILQVTWPFLLIWLAITLLPQIPAILHKRRLAASGIEDIDRMDGKTFEECLAGLFTRQGYRVIQTPYRGDWGADLILLKGGVHTVVQAKRYQKSVGVRAVQEAVAAKAKYHCREAMVVTNSRFTKQAVELARANWVVLWDREKLIDQLLTSQNVHHSIE